MSGVSTCAKNASFPCGDTSSNADIAASKSVRGADTTDSRSLSLNGVTSGGTQMEQWRWRHMFVDA